jgi:hypothetical protein
MSVNHQEDVLCFKFVFLCFKQNTEQYRNWNVTYTDGSKKVSSFKMITEADEKYWEFQKHVIL